MSTSGTYTFNPSLGELTLYAFNLCGIRNTALLQEHMESARMASNLMLSRWSNQGVNLWKVDLVTQALTTGTSTYSVDADTVVILDGGAKRPQTLFDQAGTNLGLEPRVPNMVA